MKTAGNRLYREHLDVVGLLGARLSRLIFNGLKINRENILGSHLSPIKRGMMAVMKTFNRMRPGVVAFALGHAQAVVDCTRTAFAFTSEQEKRFDAEIITTRLMLYQAAERIDQDAMESAYPSLAKVKASSVAEKAVCAAIDLLGPECLMHPFLMKWQRDVYGYEYMGGISHIQLKHVYQGFVNQ